MDNTEKNESHRANVSNDSMSSNDIPLGDLVNKWNEIKLEIETELGRTFQEVYNDWLKDRLEDNEDKDVTALYWINEFLNDLNKLKENG